MFQSVFTLLCDRDVGMALVTLPLVLKNLYLGQKIFVVDDGSLTDESIDNLTLLSPQLSVITRSERENFILEEIKDYPNLEVFRSEIPLAFKLVDIPLLAQQYSPRFTYTDSDIIYLQNCKPYFNRTVNTYLRTDGIKLSAKLRSVLLKYNWPIPYKFNSGYFSYDVNEYDLDLVNFFVSRPDVRNIPWLIEQTGWALLFGQSKSLFCPSEEQFICREIFNGPGSNTLAIHLIGRLKGKVSEWSSAPVPSTDADGVPVFEQGRNINFLDWAAKTGQRMISL